MTVRVTGGLYLRDGSVRVSAPNSEAGDLRLENWTIPPVHEQTRDLFGKISVKRVPPEDAATVIVEEPPAVTEVGLSVAVAPDGAPETARSIDSAEPLTSAVEMVLPSLPPAARVSAVGLAEIGFRLDETEHQPLAVELAHQIAAQEIPGYGLGRTAVERLGQRAEAAHTGPDDIIRVPAACRWHMPCSA